MVDEAARTARDAGGDSADAVVGGFVVDGDAVDVLCEIVADDALDEVGLLVDAGGAGLVTDVGLEVLPDGEKAAKVADKSALGGTGTDGADDEADVVGEREAVEDLLQPLALLGVADLARDAAQLAARHHDKVAAGNAEGGRNARPLGANRPLGDLDDNFGARGKPLGNLLVGVALPARDALGGVGVLVVEARLIVREHVPIVQKCVLLESDVHERGLEVVFEVLDAALVDGAHQPFVRGMLHLELLEVAVFDDGDARLKLFGVDDDLALDLLLSKQPAQYRHEL